MEYDHGCPYRRFEFVSLETPDRPGPPLMFSSSYTCPSAYALESPNHFSAKTWLGWHLLHYGHHHDLCNHPRRFSKFLESTTRSDMVIYVECNRADCL